MISKVLVYPNGSRDIGFSCTRRVIAFLLSHGIQTAAYDPDKVLTTSGSQVKNADLLPKEDFDLAIVLGGDGTMIQCVHYLLGAEVPIIGINLGTLGYMTEIESHELESSLSEILAGRFKVEQRMMLEAVIKSDKEPDLEQHFYAVNDFVIHRDLSDGLLTVQSYIDREFLAEFRADGLIVSSPCGSTAYNFSAGGPILNPVADNIILTPLASHAMLDRSVVLRGSDELSFYIGSFTRGDKAAFSADGSQTVYVGAGTWIYIKKSKYVFQMAKVGKRSVYEIVQKKIRP